MKKFNLVKTIIEERWVDLRMEGRYIGISFCFNCDKKLLGENNHIEIQGLNTFICHECFKSIENMANEMYERNDYCKTIYEKPKPMNYKNNYDYLFIASGEPNIHIKKMLKEKNNG